jgi:hypothetical protein
MMNDQNIIVDLTDVRETFDELIASASSDCAARVVIDLRAQALPPNTIRKYAEALGPYFDFCHEARVVDMPVDEVTLLSFLAKTAELGWSLGKTNEFKLALAGYAASNGEPVPFSKSNNDKLLDDMMST